MKKGTLIISYAAAYIAAAIVTYLVFVGAQYVFYHRVVIDIVDTSMVCGLAIFITRDIINIAEKCYITDYSKKG